MELDAGAALLVISDKILHFSFPEAQVLKSDKFEDLYWGRNECYWRAES